jgi:glycosyltransferase involved in cell wall biosynthesis
MGVTACMKSPEVIQTLYFCYLGLREPLVQTQVLPYLRQVRGAGIGVSLLTFEPISPGDWPGGEARSWRAQLETDGLRWYSLPYHQQPSLPATVYDIAAGACFAARLARHERIDVLHARSHVAAVMATAAKRLSGGRLIFDIRGFFPEEYVDAGVWTRRDWKYRLAKLAEKRLLSTADGFVVLTERARQILFPGCSDSDPAGRPIEVIPCCVDLNRFRSAGAVSREQTRRELSLMGRRVLVYTGGLGGWYLTEELVQFLSVAHQQDSRTFSLILTQSAPQRIAEPMRRRGIRDQDFLVRRVAPDEIPRYLEAADLALSFIKPCYSKLSSSPTKLAEYLASGLPVICSAGIGDMDGIIESSRVGVLLREFTREAYSEALAAAAALRREPEIAERCRAAARRHFDLTSIGGARYQRLYHRLLENGAGAMASSGSAQ